MKDIKIFLAGSKELTAQREALKSVLPDMNAEYAHIGVNLKIFSYENYSDNQTAYNNFITQEADIVFFILEGEIRSKTEEELLLAAKENRRYGHPEIYIFVNKSGNGDLDAVSKMNYIEGLLKGALDKYYEEYTDEDEYYDLKELAKKYIRRYIGARKERRSLKFKRVCRSLYAPLITAVACLLAFMTIFHGVSDMDEPDAATVENRRESDINIIPEFSHNPSPTQADLSSIKPLLLVTGGGSAKNYVEKNYFDGNKIDTLSSDNNLFYIHLPSMSAWYFLREEFLDASSKYGISKRYYPICLSAAKMDTSSICYKNDEKEFLKKGSLIEIKLGEDPLIVYATGHAKNHRAFAKDKRISVQALGEMISSKDYKDYYIYTTSDNSGTLSAYEKVLGMKIDDSLKKRRMFSEITDITELQNDTALFLGSELYRPDEVRIDHQIENGVVSKAIVQSDRNSVSKPIYMYFMAYKDGNQFYLPESTLNFLKLMASSKSKNLVKYKDLNRLLNNKIYKDSLLMSGAASEIIHSVDDFIDKEKIIK